MTAPQVGSLRPLTQAWASEWWGPEREQGPRKDLHGNYRLDRLSTLPSIHPAICPSIHPLPRLSPLCTR